MNRVIYAIKKVDPKIDNDLDNLGYHYSEELSDIEISEWTGVDKSKTYSHFGKILYSILKDEVCDEFIEFEKLEEFYEKCGNL